MHSCAVKLTRHLFRFCSWSFVLSSLLELLASDAEPAYLVIFLSFAHVEEPPLSLAHLTQAQLPQLAGWLAGW